MNYKLSHNFFFNLIRQFYLSYLVKKNEKMESMASIFRLSIIDKLNDVYVLFTMTP